MVEQSAPASFEITALSLVVTSAILADYAGVQMIWAARLSPTRYDQMRVSSHEIR